MSASKAPALAGRTLMLPRTLHLPAHVVQFYQEDDALIEELAHLIGTSLVSGDAAVVIATRKHRDALARALAARDLNVAKATADGRYIALDAAETLSQILTGQMPDAQRFEELVGRTIEKAKASAKTDSPCTLIFGEMVA
ncbi:MAG: MEDS domain-containing protein, partial [Candidatus Acidiferrales bacterium]